MSAEYSVEEVLAEVERLPVGQTRRRAMLTTLAERIKADEGAVPVADKGCSCNDPRCNYDRHFGNPLRTDNQPAQAAQVDETESRLAAANALLRQCAGNVSNPLVIAIQKHFQDTAEPVAQGEADLCDCDADKYNKLPHHADCAALAAQPRAVPDGVWPKLELWFFRDLMVAQRLSLFALCGMPVDEIGADHSRQKRVLRHLLATAPSPGES